MRVVLIDGHPDESRLTSALLDIYEAALPSGSDIVRIAVRDLDFTPNLRFGYARRTPWEPDISRLAEELDACDHLVVCFPMWWGAEPAIVKGLLDRLLLPGFTFAYHSDDPWWDRLMAGRSADAIITMDTPRIFLRFAYGDSIVRRWRKQVLDFCGFKPARVLPLGPVKQGSAEKNWVKWTAKIEKLARTAGPSKPQEKAARLEGFLQQSKAASTSA
ncbi:NAD(P)H-dependent oxidoreductase [Parerythrobacter aestuarii]|uniref:NAD(P)H-dependent oxidoreductase n=1 Tax=Parerythrobacter aestuarii TaxID=3020909 RepID=UPI0024DEE242|nr:NAD(P)H-dependent oxidoreductase [Parerythrobacter aestuarii]